MSIIAMLAAAIAQSAEIEKSGPLHRAVYGHTRNSRPKPKRAKKDRSKIKAARKQRNKK